MGETLSKEEMAVLIKGRRILRARGLKLDADVKTICEAAGISRKTNYKWTDQSGPEARERENELRGELARLQAEKEELEKRYDDINFENEGRKLAWKIHGVDELIRSKKTLPDPRERRSGKFLSSSGPAASGDGLGAFLEDQHAIRMESNL